MVKDVSASDRPRKNRRRTTLSRFSSIDRRRRRRRRRCRRHHWRCRLRRNQTELIRNFCSLILLMTSSKLKICRDFPFDVEAEF